MVEGLDLETARAVIEFGPGTGVFTREILRRVGPGTRVVAIERSSSMAAALRSEFPGVLLHEDTAANAEAICRREGIEPGTVDSIVSGLPFAGFPGPLQKEILEAAIGVLRPGGRFVTFAYYGAHLKPAGRRFGQLLESLFASVERGAGAMMNIPPAFVYRCQKAG
ncbi:MAG: methyltransferase domain-containing protein [Phycisphaerae bacterium]|nr:methyltransferase domain-containing protein [Phycisphaerae bacterium]